MTGRSHDASDSRPRADIEITLRGSVAVVRGVVERLEGRELILQALASLDSITGVEDDLRPAA
jgi:hypothetical protein